MAQPDHDLVLLDAEAGRFEVTEWQRFTCSGACPVGGWVSTRVLAEKGVTT
jgi:hypothetical protein